MNKYYKFPEGTTKISAGEIQQALCQYERVEIPGTVVILKISATDYADQLKATEIVLHEGTTEATLHSKKKIAYNVPKSLTTIRQWGGHHSEENFNAPRILCLPPFFKEARGLVGVEYLQAYSTSDIRYDHLDHSLKHYVYLGETAANKQDLFNLVEGGVIHVESKKMALSVLKRLARMTGCGQWYQTGLERYYVVTDAAEWKDFPADKLALSMEAYNPEALILPEQRQMREACKKERSQHVAQRQAEERDFKKSYMLKTILRNMLDGVIPEWDKAYNLIVDKEPDGNAYVCRIRLRIGHNIWDDQKYRESLGIEIQTGATELIERKEILLDTIRQCSDLVSKNRDYICRHCTFGPNMSNIPAPKIELPLLTGSNITITLSCNQLNDDVRQAASFVDQLNSIIQKAQENGI